MSYFVGQGRESNPVRTTSKIRRSKRFGGIPLLGQISYTDTTNLFMLGESRGGITDMSFYLKDRP